MADLYKRKGSKIYWGRVQVDGKDERRSLQTADRRLAKERLKQWLDDIGAAKWGDKRPRTFAEAAERFIREHMTTLKPSSARRYGVSLKNLAPHFGGKTLDQIGTAALSEFETARRNDGVRAGTIRRDLSCLSSLVTSSVMWEWLGVNPVPSYLRSRSKRGLKESPPRTRYLTTEEEARLLANSSCLAGLTGDWEGGAATSPVREAITLAIDTGLRRDELFSLQWSQLDLKRGIVSTTKRTKSGKLRQVPLPFRSRTIVGTLPRYRDCPYVFVSPRTGTRYVNMETGFKAAARRAGIKDLIWHDLRRTAGCRWLQRDGRRMEEVSMLLGHSSVMVTERSYAFLNAEDVAESISSRTNVGT
jgi:integrase